MVSHFPSTENLKTAWLGTCIAPSNQNIDGMPQVPDGYLHEALDPSHLSPAVQLSYCPLKTAADFPSERVIQKDRDENNNVSWPNLRNQDLLFLQNHSLEASHWLWLHSSVRELGSTQLSKDYQIITVLIFKTQPLY